MTDTPTPAASGDQAEPSRDRAVPSRARALLLAAAIGGALSNFGILFIAARSLGTRENTEFLVFWSLLFGAFGVLSGVQNETTRASSRPSPVGARVFATTGIIGVGALVLIGATAPMWAPVMLPRTALMGGLLLAIIGLLYPLYVTLVGALGGARRWEEYAWAPMIEVVLRVGLVLIAAAVGLRLVGFEVASAAAVLTLGVMLVLFPSARRALGARSDVPLGRSLRNALLAMSSTACTAVLVTGYSALVALTNPPASMPGMDPVAATTLTGACMLAVSLTRAPIMMPLTAFVGVAISAFTEHTGTVAAAVRKPFLLLGALGLAGAVAAWQIGPWALRLFRPEYDLPGWYFAVLTASSVLMAWLTILGALALATGHHVLYVAGWGIASASAVVCLLLPLHLLVTTSLSLSVGPALGCALLAVALSRAPRGAVDPEATSAAP